MAQHIDNTQVGHLDLGDNRQTQMVHQRTINFEIKPSSCQTVY